MPRQTPRAGAAAKPLRGRDDPLVASVPAFPRAQTRPRPACAEQPDAPRADRTGRGLIRRARFTERDITA